MAERAMHYLSTRGAAQETSLSAALAQGLAPDGGLYVPDHWPRVSLDSAPRDLPLLAPALLQDFFAGDALAPHLNAICAEAFTFPAPLVAMGDEAQLLELFHGPTAAFKDFGARFLAACLARVERSKNRELHILVATSGDTGGAVAAAFHRRPGIRVTVLYPKGLVSPLQEKQLTCWDDNVQTFAVRGTFDECQRLVKEAFTDAGITARYQLSSANSINVGRLLPQMTYFAAASLEIKARTGQPASFVIPSGNLGHSTACVWARQVGMPIGEIVLAHNANRTFPDYLESGEWRPRASVATLASAMDVGNPSNAERLRHLAPELEKLRGVVTAYAVEDAAIRDRIRFGFERYGQIWCPHTAAGVDVFERHVKGKRPGNWVIAATAHPAKFPEVVEPIIGRAAPVPETLRHLLAQAGVAPEIEANIEALRAKLL